MLLLPRHARSLSLYKEVSECVCSMYVLLMCEYECAL